MDPFDILLKPVVTEESMKDMEGGKYAFYVTPNATRTDIRNAVEKAFNVRVIKVNTMNLRGKMRRVRTVAGRTPDRKKAIVTVASGQRIEFFEGLR